MIKLRILENAFGKNEKTEGNEIVVVFSNVANVSLTVGFNQSGRELICDFAVFVIIVASCLSSPDSSIILLEKANPIIATTRTIAK